MYIYVCNVYLHTHTHTFIHTYIPKSAAPTCDCRQRARYMMPRMCTVNVVACVRVCGSGPGQHRAGPSTAPHVMHM